tara:strand:- start:738 stop:905 length:168 start_codon:yes stop_codon:yes gene_type:complete
MKFNKLIKQILEGARKDVKVRKRKEGRMNLGTKVIEPKKGGQYKRPKNKKEIDDD